LLELTLVRLRIDRLVVMIAELVARSFVSLGAFLCCLLGIFSRLCFLFSSLAAEKSLLRSPHFLLSVKPNRLRSRLSATRKLSLRRMIPERLLM
jgi:hypothetical protein